MREALRLTAINWLCSAYQFRTAERWCSTNWSRHFIDDIFFMCLRWWKPLHVDQESIVFATRPQWVNFFFLEPFNHFRHWNFRRWNGRGAKRIRALGKNETASGVRWNGAILPRSILPHNAILPQHTMFHFAPEITLRESHYVNYNIARCAIKWCENANKRYIIISNPCSGLVLNLSKQLMSKRE